MFILLEKNGLVAFHVFGPLLVYFNSLFAFPLSVINKLCSVIEALPGHVLYYF